MIKQPNPNNTGFCSEIELLRAFTGNANVISCETYTESINVKDFMQSMRELNRYIRRCRVKSILSRIFR